MKRTAGVVLLMAFGLSIGFLVFLGLAEVYLRWVYPIPLRIQGQKIILPVNRVYEFHGATLRGADPTIIHRRNSLGFRGAEPPKDFSSTLSVVTVGGSTTECFYLTEGKTWPDRLGVLLSGALRSVWLNNAGLDGHSTFGHLLLVQDYLIKLRPRLAVFLIGLNDIERDDLNGFDGSFLKHRNPLSALMNILRENFRVVAWAQNVRLASLARRRGLGHEALDFKHPAYLSVDDKVRARLVAHQEVYLPSFKKRVELLVSACRAAGIVPVLVTQPFLGGPLLDDVTGADLARLEMPDRRYNGRVLWDILERYNEQTRNVGVEQGVLVIDLAREMPKSTRYFYDPYHFTNAGAEKVASIVSRFLIPYLRQQFPEFATSSEKPSAL